MVKQNTTIKLRNDQIEELKTYGKMGDHWQDVIDNILNLAKQATIQTSKTIKTNEAIQTEFKEAIVDKYGKAMISRTLAEQTIEWRVKK